MFSNTELVFVRMLVEQRLEDIERLAREHPSLPMRDPATVGIYSSIVRKTTAQLLDRN
jgi:methyl coenzyme M reductase gamma subunit